MTVNLAWRDAVVDTVHEAAEEAGLDPYALLDSRSFVESLDPLVGLDGEALTLGVTEAVQASKAPYGDVAYADPGYQKDKKKRYPLDTDDHIRAAWSYINQADNAGQYDAAHLKLVKARIRAAMKRIGAQVTEAVIDGQRTFDETEDLVEDALTARDGTGMDGYSSLRVVDLTGGQVVYRPGGGDDLYQCSYAIADDDAVTLGDPTPVERTYVPVADRNPPPEDDDTGEVDGQAAEAVDRIPGRVLEARGTDENGGRIYHVRILKYGDSRNGRRYSEAVMARAVPLYEGAKAYDHHRTSDELKTSTLAGLVGSYRNVEAGSDGLYGDLHLLPGATHTAECLDASLAAQAAGRPPVVGVSHDVMAHFQPISAGGRRLQEATQIVDVQSADVVANPSAGGLAVRAVAGGTETEEPEVPPTKADYLAALSEATDDELAAVGLARPPSKTTESTTAPVRAVESTERATEGGTFDKTSALGRLVARDKLETAGLAHVAESFIADLPEKFTEADVDERIGTARSVIAMLAKDERRGLAPGIVQVGKDQLDRKVESLDAFFWEYGRPHNHWSGVGATSKRPNDAVAYKSFREAYIDFTGYRPDFLGREDVNRLILRESFGDGRYESGMRVTESLSSSSWNTVLGDSLTRRLVAEYSEPALMDWMKIVSSMPPVNDFRTQRIERIGGYGILPVVNQGAPYQPLTSPTNEEVTYAIGKRGGTEDVTLEMIANDDVRAISKIPFHLALAAKRTLFDFVFELVRPDTSTFSGLGTAGNPNIYDSTALYAAGHNNTTSTALSQTALSASRAKMRKQAGYGDTANILSLIPAILLVPPTLEEIAFQLCTSAVAIPATPAGAANTPNIHKGLDYIVIDYWDAQSTTGWSIVADPNLVPTVEIGFYQGQRDPQLFTQSDQAYGSMFNADKFTYKIRHVYSGATLDFRGFQRGNS